VRRKSASGFRRIVKSPVRNPVQTWRDFSARPLRSLHSKPSYAKRKALGQSCQPLGRSCCRLVFTRADADLALERPKYEPLALLYPTLQRAETMDQGRLCRVFDLAAMSMSGLHARPQVIQGGAVSPKVWSWPECDRERPDDFCTPPWRDEFLRAATASRVPRTLRCENWSRHRRSE
jgi:hypothetical protein